MKVNQPSVRWKTTIVNVLLFNFCWWVSAWSVLRGSPLLGPLTVTCVLLIHAYLMDNPRKELMFLVIMGGVGYFVDNMLTSLKILTFPANQGPFPAPIWLGFQWGAFCSLLHVSLRWMRTRLLLSAVLGAGGGASAYWSADVLGVLSLGDPPWLALIVLGIIWAVIFPLFLWVSRQSSFDVVPAIFNRYQ